MRNDQREFKFVRVFLRVCSMHNGVMERSSSRGRISRQPSQIIRQLSSTKMSSECCVHEKKPSQPVGRDSFQHDKPKWQDSLRGSSAPNGKQSIEKYKRGELSTQSSKALTSAVSQSGLRTPISPRRRFVSKYV